MGKFCGSSIKSASRSGQSIKKSGRPANLGAPRRTRCVPHKRTWSHDMRNQAPALIDEETLNGLLGRAITDFGATSLAALVVIGDRLGLYRVLAANGAMTRRRSRCEERHARTLCSRMAQCPRGFGYVNYLADSGRYQLSPEQAMLFAQEESPAFIVGGFQTALAAGRIVDRLTDAFKSGEGIGWHEHHPDMFPGLRTVLQSGLSQSPGPGVDPLARRRRRQTQGRNPRRRRGLRCGLLDVDHGQGLSELAVHGVRLSRGVDCHRPDSCSRGRASAM